MRTRPLAALSVLFLGLVALGTPPPAVRADTPLPPPAKHVATSRSGLVLAETDPATDLTTVYRVAPDGGRERRWAMPGWYRALYVADDGDHLVIGFPGLNLLPTNAADDLVVLRFVRRGEVIRALALHDVVPDRSLLKRTASHLLWREGEGFDAQGRFVVVTVDGVRHPYDPTTGLEVADAPKGGEASDLDRLVAWMTGTFSSAAQAKADPDFLDVTLHLARVWRARTDAAWFYVEQALSKSPTAPYRQRVYRVRALADGICESRVYELPEPEKAVGAWNDATPLASLAPETLVERAGCAVMLRATDAKTFAGGTLGSRCASTLKGATHATSEVTVTADGLVSWDRGFDAKGAQVWGSTKGGYRFDRVSAPAGGTPPKK